MLYLRVADLWHPGSTYVVEVDSVRNANGAVANTRGPIEMPKPKPDSTKSRADSAGTPADTSKAAPPAPPGK